MQYCSIPCQFPQKIHRLLAALSEDRTDMALALPAFMGTLSTVAQGKFGVMHPSGHLCALSMFWLGIAESSAGKGGVFRNVRRPLEKLIAERIEQDKQKIVRAKAENENSETEIKYLRRKLPKLEGQERVDTQERIVKLECGKRIVPHEFVFDTQDVTRSGLIKLLNCQEGNRVGILDAEGRIFSSILDDPSLHTVLNQAYDGEPISSSRSGGSSCNGIKALVSMGITTQPCKLAALNKKPEFWDEGFIPRVMPVFSVSLAGTRPAVGVTNDQWILRWYEERMAFLFSFPWLEEGHGKLGTHVLQLDEDAESLWRQHADYLELCQGTGCFLHPISAWLGKAATATLRMAALFHLFESESPVQERINARIMQSAIWVCNALTPHVQKIYDSVHPNPLYNTLERVVNWMRSCWGTKSYVTLRDIYRSTGLRQAAVFPVIRLLRELGCIWDAWDPRIVQIPGSGGAGRPKSMGFCINFDVLNRLDLEALSSNFPVQYMQTSVLGLRQ